MDKREQLAAIDALTEIDPGEDQAAADHAVEKSKPRILDRMAARGFQLYLRTASPEEIPAALDEMTGGKLSPEELEERVRRFLRKAKIRVPSGNDARLVHADGSGSAARDSGNFGSHLGGTISRRN